MARKRGGLAGLWDRNKNVIKPIATGLVGMIPGIGIPLASGLGAAMGGLDRPGKSGVGFDAGAGLKGGLQGAAMGAVGAGAKAGLSSLLGGGQAGASGVGAGGGVAMPTSLGGTLATPAGGIGGAVAPSALSVGGASGINGATSTLGKIGGALNKAGDWAENHKTVMRAGEGLLKGMAPPQINPADQANADRQNFELERQKAGMGNPALSQQLQDIIRRLMAGGGQAALSPPTVPGYNNYMGR